MDEIEIHLKSGKKYSICSCGLSKTLPYCDNEHREYNEKNSTQYKSIKIITEEDTRLLLKASNWQNPPKSEN